MKDTEWDVFISHAWEDKESFARPLAKELRRRGLRVWFDEFTLRVGDSLRRSIDHGLANSRYGVVILSPSFFAKEWPQKELDGLVAREVDGTKVILPVWHNITVEQIRKYSPMLAGRLAAKSGSGLGCVVTDLIRAMEFEPDQSAIATPSTETGKQNIPWGTVSLPFSIIAILMTLTIAFVLVARGFFSIQPSVPVSPTRVAEVKTSSTQQVTPTSVATATLAPPLESTPSPTSMPATQVPPTSTPLRTPTASSTATITPLPLPTATATGVLKKIERGTDGGVYVNNLLTGSRKRILGPVGDCGRVRTPQAGGWIEAPRCFLNINGFSPDGDRVLATVAWNNGTGDYGEALRIVTDDGNRTTDIFRTGPPDSVDVALGAIPSWNAVWSPDGQRIAFRLQYKSDFGIFLINASGTNLQRLGSSQLDDRPSYWSADGKWIIQCNTGAADCFAFGVDGKSRVTLTQIGTKVQVFDQTTYPWAIKNLTLTRKIWNTYDTWEIQ